MFKFYIEDLLDLFFTLLNWHLIYNTNAITIAQKGDNILLNEQP